MKRVMSCRVRQLAGAKSDDSGSRRPSGTIIRLASREDLVDRAALHQGGARRGLMEQRLDAAAMNRLPRGVHRHEFAGRQQAGRRRDGEQRRHPELAGDVGQVPGEAALLGHDRGCAVEQRGPARLGLPHHQDRAFRKRQHVRALLGDEDRSAGRPGAGGDPAAEDRGGAGRRGRRRGVGVRGRDRLLLQRPALQEGDDALGIDGPLDVLGRAVVAFQQDGRAGQRDRLRVRDGRQLPFVAGHIQAADALLGVADELAVLRPDVLGDDGHGVGARDDDQVAGGAAVHHGLGQSPDRVGEDPVVVDVHRVAAVGHAPGRGVHHGEAAHAHGHVLVAEAPGQAVGDGLQAVRAGQHPAVGVEQGLGADVQLGAVLAGKRAAGGVLAQRAAAQGDRDRAAGLGFHDGPGRPDGRDEVGGHLGADDHLLDFGAQGVERVDPVALGGLHAAVDFGLQVVVLEEALVGARGDGEPRRHPELQAVLDFAQVGHLAADDIRHVLGHGAQGDHQALVGHGRAAGQDLVDRLLNLIEPLEESGVFPRRELLDVADHGKDVHRDRGAGGAHEGHPEGFGRVQGLLDFGHDLEGLVVGAQEQLEAVVAVLELDAQAVDVFSPFRLLAGE